MSLLSVREVTVRFGGVTALDGISLELNRGEILGLIGPNGAGKTTLFNVITGVIRPDSGRVSFGRRNLRGLRPHQRARLGIARTFQNLQLWGTMSVLDNVKLPIDALGPDRGPGAPGARWPARNLLADALGLPYSIHAERAADERARAILHVLELDQHAGTPAADLPVGIQRKVEIARALAMRPALLLLDEPAAGLDAQETLHLVDVLKRVRERFKVSMLLVDHDMNLVMPACDYIYVLDFGRMLASGRPPEIRSNPKVIGAYLGEAAGAPRKKRKQIPHTGEPLLEVGGLAAGYDQLEVIRDVALEVWPGEVVAVIGANGAGKSTTLRAISGVIKPRRGKVRFAGRDITGWRSDRIVRQGLVHIPQGRGLFPKLTVLETLQLSAYSGHRGRDVSAAFEIFPRLAERQSQLVGTLSGGEQQMVALARALLVRPKLLMIDEMSQGLAPALVKQLFESIDVFRAEGVAVLLVEQFVDSALGVADRAYIFENGGVSREGRAVELQQDQTVIASSYLGAAAEDEDLAKAAGGNGHQRAAELMEDFMLKLPADLLRVLQERAGREGRPTAELVREMLEASKR